MIIFNSESLSWETLLRGELNFHPRQWNPSDPRIVALSEMTLGAETLHRRPVDGFSLTDLENKAWAPTVKTIAFRNKATDEVLTFEFKGVDFLSCTPKWIFLMLGECLGVITP